MPLANDLDMAQLLVPIQVVLDQGNQAMQWLDRFSSGHSVEDVVRKSIVDMEVQEISIIKPEAVLG